MIDQASGVLKKRRRKKRKERKKKERTKERKKCYMRQVNNTTGIVGSSMLYRNSWRNKKDASWTMK